MDAETWLGPVRKKVTHYEGLRTPGVTGTCDHPQSVNFGSLPMPSGAVTWSEGAVNWAEYLNAQIPNSTYLGTLVATLPSTTVQSSVSLPENLGIPSRFAAPSLPPGLSQTAGPSVQPGQSSRAQPAGPSGIGTFGSGFPTQSASQPQYRGLGLPKDPYSGLGSYGSLGGGPEPPRRPSRRSPPGGPPSSPSGSGGDDRDDDSMGERQSS